MRFIKHQRVSASISDSAANLSVLGVFQVVQDAVTEMMGRLKIDGVTVRKQYNSLWAFTRNRIKFFKAIPWGDDEFTVTAFISSITRATLSVDVSVKDITGKLCAYARVEMCALDLTTMRIRRVETVGVTSAMQAEPPETDIKFTVYDGTPDNKVDTVTVHSTNIDMSQHTNNAEYVRFILNTYSVKELTERPIREMEVRYINQSYENNVLDIYKQSQSDKDVFLLTSGEKDIAKCEVLF
ncbi:MAG: hypothetical protein J1F71_04900 [Clostridiales bacterium]|nr:hypothetical protein [Clostridiales bacterium]